MRNKLLLILMLFCALLGKAQNLMPNSSFEDTISGPFGSKFSKHWKSPTIASPDYYTPFHNDNRPMYGTPSNFSGFQNANTGVAYMGLLIYTLSPNNDSKRFREYIQNELSRPLEKDSTYCMQMFISLADSFRYASKNKLGIYLSSNKVQSNDFFYLPQMPQIMVSPDTFITEKENWKKFNFSYTADGGEKYLTIGNFTDSTEIDTLFVGGGAKDNLQWKGTYYYIDDIYLGHCDSVPLDTPNAIYENVLASKLKAYPNPSSNQFYVESNEQLNLQFQLFNVLGIQQKVEFQQSSNRYEFSMAHLPKGIYLLRVIAGEEQTTIKLLKE